MGIAAALAAAGIWAASAALMASQTARVDALSISALRALWATLFFAVALFALGAEGDLAAMSAGTIVELIFSALIGLALGDTLYVVSIGLLGMNRAFTISIGMFTLFSFALSAIFLGEPIGWDTALGAALVLLGVYLVALYGRETPPAAALAASATSLAAPPGAEGEPPPIAGGGTGAGMPTAAIVKGRPGRPVWLRGTGAAGLLVVALAALFWSIATVWLRDASAGFDATAVGTVRIPAAALVLGAAAAARPGSTLRRRAVPQRGMGILAVAGLFGTGVGSLLFIFAVQELGAGKTAVLSSISPVFALALGALFLGEPITRWLAAGTALAVGGIVLLA